jgi:hypothetical protein
MNLTRKTFIEWCKHYEYNPESPEAAADYRLYVEQLDLFQSLPEEPCFLDDDQPPEPPTRVMREDPALLSQFGEAVARLQSSKAEG